MISYAELIRISKYKSQRIKSLWDNKLKVGKTTLASELDKVLIAGFEQGTNALHNVLVQPILKWQDWKAVVKQLIKDKDKLADKIHTVAIDTVDEAYKLCEKYMCNQAGVETVKDIAAFGKKSAA